jgi:hypothetical protein
MEGCTEVVWRATRGGLHESLRCFPPRAGTAYDKLFVHANGYVQFTDAPQCCQEPATTPGCTEACSDAQVLLPSPLPGGLLLPYSRLCERLRVFM